MRILITLLKFLLPLVVIGVGLSIAMYFMKTSKKPERRSKPPSMQVIEVLELTPRDYQTRIKTRGTVSPRTQSTLVSEVTGRIVKVSPNFREGSFFEKGDLLVNIDRRDYEQALTIIKAELAQAQLSLSEGRAQSQQAERDWKKLGLRGKPSELVLRRPQLKSSQASVAAAKARVKQAETDLERTKIRAPYAGRILSKQADIGQFVSRGNVLASIYAVDYVEVRLPVTEQQAAFLDLPEAYQGESTTSQGPEVKLIVNSAGKSWEWTGRIVRTEGTIDIKSRQQFAIVQVDKPYAKQADGRPPLKVGQFVTAEIEGHKIPSSIVLPRELVRGKDEVLVINKENKVEKRNLEVIWRDDKNIVVSSGLKAGERISKTLLSFATDGTEVVIKGEERRNRKGKKGKDEPQIGEDGNRPDKKQPQKKPPADAEKSAARDQ